jgi:hypothetical protein
LGGWEINALNKVVVNERSVFQVEEGNVVEESAAVVCLMDLDPHDALYLLIRSGNGSSVLSGYDLDG